MIIQSYNNVRPGSVLRGVRRPLHDSALLPVPTASGVRAGQRATGGLMLAEDTLSKDSRSQDSAPRIDQSLLRLKSSWRDAWLEEAGSQRQAQHLLRLQLQLVLRLAHPGERAVDEDVHLSRGAVGQRQRHRHHTETAHRDNTGSLLLQHHMLTHESSHFPSARTHLQLVQYEDKRVCVGLGVVQVGLDELGQLCGGRDGWRRKLGFKLEQHHLLGFLKHTY
ncbi:hypothetical protein FQN60_013253 [Etheostoma spectabile]|uniref:Uncharacterized protein n=1 Tax=Etheostoma spectabile TaxID=54343 RepID=A0A5J5D5A2_9PERO|nr:hypothetical protein FQN60_013253 [Etheostoma spectabile]